MRRAWLLLLALPLAGSPTAARAQERRVPVPVDYLAGADVYVALGARDGLVEGDTVPAYTASGERHGVFLARVVAVKRTVLAYAGERFSLAVGDTLWLELRRPPPAAEQPTERPGASPTPPPPPAGRRLSSLPARQPRLDGRISFELDAVQSTAFARGTERYATPSLRLNAIASELPGGFRVSTNAQATRLAGFGSLQPVTALRVYQAVVEKTFTALPLLLQAGRFYSPLQAGGGYWDGGLLRVGGDAFGAGAAAGFLPSLADEGFSTDVRRVSVFADVHARPGLLRYDAEVGWHMLRPRAGVAYAEQTFAGLGQRLRYRGLWLSQTAEVDRDSAGGWMLSTLQASASLALSPGLAVRAGGARNRGVPLAGPAPLPSYFRDRGSVGISWFGAALNASTDFSVTRRAGGETTRAWSGSLQVPRALAGFGLGGSATLASSGDLRTTYLAGELSRSLGRGFARAAFRTTGFDDGTPVRRSDGVELTLDLPLRGSTWASMRLEHWWGSAGGARQRVLTSISTGL